MHLDSKSFPCSEQQFLVLLLIQLASVPGFHRSSSFLDYREDPWRYSRLWVSLSPSVAYSCSLHIFCYFVEIFHVQTEKWLFRYFVYILIICLLWLNGKNSSFITESSLLSNKYRVSNSFSFVHSYHSTICWKDHSFPSNLDGWKYIAWELEGWLSS